LVHAGDLVFDVGGNYGEKTKIYRALGCSVVVVEPQEECIAYLRERFAQDRQVSIVPAALGACLGESELKLSDIRCQLSSMSDHWIAAVKESGRFSRYGWTRSVTVPLHTLDSLMQRFGQPAFCKIDVEGYEYEVLRGLNRAIPCMSFEFHVEYLEPTLSSIKHVSSLGPYEFNLTKDNRTHFELQTWVPAQEIMNILQAIPQVTLQGDVYARVRET
jgi:FkbM family methyltransferase